MQTQATLSVSSDYLARLVVKTRGLQAREAEVDPDSGSNPTDDNMIDTLQDSFGDLSRQEVQRELQGLDDRQQAELVALMWIGRGDAEPEEWNQTVELARQLKAGPTPRYLLRHPLVAEHWQEGAAKLGIELAIGG
jgi:Tfp pilus assembly PilM family ATPase